MFKNYPKFQTRLLAIAIPTIFLFQSCSEDTDNLIEDTNTISQDVEADFTSGTDDGFYWQLWYEDVMTGTVDYTNGANGNFEVVWDCDGNYTCGKGWSTGETNRVLGYNCGTYTHTGGGGNLAMYGWTREPLIEYYVQERWPGTRPNAGIIMGTIESNGVSYTLRREQRVEKPSIDGTQTFWQLKSTRETQAPIATSHTINFATHAAGWESGGMALGTEHNYQILLQESWGVSAGHVDATVWGAGSAGPEVQYPAGEKLTMTVRAKGISGDEQIKLIVGGNDVGTWTLSTSMADYSVDLYSSRGDIVLEYTNDDSGRDVEVDYIQVGNITRQAEDQEVNTAVWQDGSCGGSYSQLMQCSGYIEFGPTI